MGLKFCLFLQADEDSASGQLLVYDGLQQQQEGVEQFHQGVELLADPSYNYQYYIIDATGIQRVTLFWVMSISSFLQDMGTNCKLYNRACSNVFKCLCIRHAFGASTSYFLIIGKELECCMIISPVELFLPPSFQYVYNLTF